MLKHHDLMSFLSGAAFVQVPTPLAGQDALLEIVVFAFKSAIGGIVALGINRLADRFTKKTPLK